MILSLLLGLSSAVTFDDPRMEATWAYRRSVSYPVYVRECSALIPEKKNDFSSALKDWNKRNRDKIKAGRELIRQEGKKTGRNTIAMTEGTAGLGWRMIEDASEDVRKKFCIQQLEEMSE